MKKRKALVFFLFGSAAILLAAVLVLVWMRRHPLTASLAGAILVIAGGLALLLRRLPPLLFPRRAAERQLTRLLRRSPQATLLYSGTQEEDVPPDLSLPARVEHREGIDTLRLSLGADCTDLPALLSLPAGAALTLVLPVSPAEILSLTGTVSPLPGDGTRQNLLFAVQTIRLPHLPHPILIQK